LSSTPTHSASDESLGDGFVAPAWHTALLVSVILAVVATGTLLGSGSAARAAIDAPHTSRIASVYGPTIVVSWAMVFYVARIGRRACALRGLLGRSWTTVGRGFGDLALGLATWLFICAFEHAWRTCVGPTANSAVLMLLPASLTERAAWVLVSVSVGFSEEVVYRGYLLTQLKAFGARAPLAVVLQAGLFGLAHADQGIDGIARLAFYGLLLGILATARRSLWPGIVGHVVTNLVSGLVGA